MAVVSVDVKETRDTLRTALRHGVNIDCKDGFTGGTPLHQAAMNGNAFTVELLVRYGANVDARNDMGYTPLKFTRELLKQIIAEGDPNHEADTLRTVICLLEQTRGVD